MKEVGPVWPLEGWGFFVWSASSHKPGLHSDHGQLCTQGEPVLCNLDDSDMRSVFTAFSGMVGNEDGMSFGLVFITNLEKCVSLVSVNPDAEQLRIHDCLN